MGTEVKGPDPAVLSAMLEAREERWQKRMKLAERYPSLISATLCIPLPLRTRPAAENLLRQGAEVLIQALREAGLGPVEPEWITGADGPAAFIPCQGEAKAVKRLCVQQEERLPQGRLLDLDVTEKGGTPVGRSELGLPPRKCFLCGRPAAECVAGARHNPDEISAYVKRTMEAGFPGKERQGR